jgi:hypothetical protein
MAFAEIPSPLTTPRSFVEAKARTVDYPMGMEMLQNTFVWFSQHFILPSYYRGKKTVYQEPPHGGGFGPGITHGLWQRRRNTNFKHHQLRYYLYYRCGQLHRGAHRNRRALSDALALVVCA